MINKNLKMIKYVRIKVLIFVIGIVKFVKKNCNFEMLLKNMQVISFNLVFEFVFIILWVYYFK